MQEIYYVETSYNNKTTYIDLPLLDLEFFDRIFDLKCTIPWTQSGNCFGYNLLWEQLNKATINPFYG